MKTKIFINGFGRIGRAVLRAILKTERRSDFEILGINDLEGPDICAYLLEYDSIYGTLGLPTNYKIGHGFCQRFIHLFPKVYRSCQLTKRMT